MMCFTLLFPCLINQNEPIPHTWGMLFIAAVAIIMLFFLVYGWAKRNQWKKNSILTEGTATYVKSTYRLKFNGGMRLAEDLEIRVRFTDLQGCSYDLPCKRYAFDFIEVKQGDKVKIYYNPYNPNDFYAELHTP